MPKDHLLSHEKIDSITCCPEDEDTMITTLPSTVWMKILHPKMVFDLYSDYGIYLATLENSI
jgi:hypothetical protein